MATKSTLRTDIDFEKELCAAAPNPHQINVTGCHSERSEESILKYFQSIIFSGLQC